MKRFAIWNKKDPIITLDGKVHTPEQWIEKYPMFGLEHIVPICAAGEVNGTYYNTLGRMVDDYAKTGCDFSACKTDEDKLNAIEAFLDARDAAEAEAIANATAKEELTAMSLASIAASLEYQNMLTLDDVEG